MLTRLALTLALAPNPRPNPNPNPDLGAALAAVLLVGGEKGARLARHVSDRGAVDQVGAPARHGEEGHLVRVRVRVRVGVGVGVRVRVRVRVSLTLTLT